MPNLPTFNGSTLVDRKIGDAYWVVNEVYKNLPELKNISEGFNDFLTTSGQTLEEITESKEAVLSAEENVTQLADQTENHRDEALEYKNSAAQSAEEAVTSITYDLIEKTGTTYVLQSSDCSVGCVTILELSNDLFTEMTLPTPLSLSVTAGMGFNVVITGEYNGQTLVDGAGVELFGSPAFVESNHCKTVIAVSNTQWRIFG